MLAGSEFSIASAPDVDWYILCEVSASLESSRQSRALPGGLPAKFHHRVVDARRNDCHVHTLWHGPAKRLKQCEEWSTRGGQSKPVQLTRFQSLHLAALYLRLRHASLASHDDLAFTLEALLAPSPRQTMASSGEGRLVGCRSST